MKSQCLLILSHLQSGKTINQMQALNLFKCMLLASRIHDLKCMGHDIHSIIINTPNGKKYAEYFLKVKEN